MKLLGRKLGIGIAIIVVGSVLAIEPIYAQTEPTQIIESTPKKKATQDSDEISINLPEKVTLEQLIEIVSRETGTLFIYKKQNLRGELSITMPTNFKIKKKDVFTIFEMLLTTQGLTLVRNGDSNIVELIPGPEARFQKLPLAFDGDVINADPSDYVMRIRRIKHVDLNYIKEAIQPFFSKTGTLLTYDWLRLLVIIDSQVNIDRVSEIIDLLDVEDPEELRQVMTVYKMKHTQVEETHKMVSSIYSNIVHSGRQEPVKFILDPRQNSLIIFSNKAGTEEVKKLLALVDVPVPETGIELTIHPLNFATPGSIAPLLSQIFGQKKIPLINVEPLKAETPEKKDEAPTETAKENEEANANKENIEANANVSVDTDSVKIIPFDNLNALIIIADPATTKDIVSLVEQLDVEQGEFQLVLHPLKFASASVLGPLLGNIFSDQIVAGKGKGQTAAQSRIKIIPEPRLNSLIIIADKFTVQRIIRLIDQLDVGGGDAEFTVYNLRYAKAGAVANLLNAIFTKTVVTGQEKEAQQELLIVPDNRLNLLVIFAGKIRTQRILQLLEKLDLPAGEDVAQSQFKLYRLQHAVAKDIATLLKDVTGNIVDVAKSEDTNLSQPSNTPKVANENEAVPVSQELVASKQSQLNKETARRISITVDETTNVVLAFGPKEIFPTLDRIIEQLDIPRVQVYIEAMIIETTLGKSLDFGVNWTATGPTSDGGSLVSGGFPNATPLTPKSGVQKAGKSVIGVVNGGTLKFEGQTFLSFGAFIQAVQTESDINILANPQLLMLNNEEASLNVSRVIPVATKSVADANGRVTDQIEFRDVGVIASIRPQISGDNSIRLEIQQTSSDVSPTPVGTSKAVTTFKRELKTSVITASDSIVVLGGLLQEQLSQNESKIPGLGDLPLIGWLFKSSSKKVDKINLMMFIRPTIVRNQEDLMKVTLKANERYQQGHTGKPFHEMMDNLKKDSPAEQLDQ